MRVPVIASGGVGTLDHLVEGIRDGHATAVLAASIFHFGDIHDRRGEGPYGPRRAAMRARLSEAGAGLSSLHIGGAGADHRGSAAAPTAEQSYTQSLLTPAPARAAQKLGEEAVETVIAAVKRTRTALVEEAADLLYHCLSCFDAGMSPWRVMAELERRTGQSGHAEKAGTRAENARVRMNEMDQLFRADRSRPTGFSPAPSGRSSAPTRR